MTTSKTQITGLDLTALHTFWDTCVDHNGLSAEPFVAEDARWPVRCCLQDSQPGDALAVVAWSAFPWRGPYAETGPVVLHAEPCAGGGCSLDRVPEQFHPRRQLLRPYGRDKRIAYDHIRLIEPHDDLDAAIEEVLGIDDVAFIQARNVFAGCYSFTAQRK
jgi:hypothetical protein